MNFCKECRFSHDTKPGGQIPSHGTLWCDYHNMQTAKNRHMPCFTATNIKRFGRCFECKNAKITKPTRELPRLGNIWCDSKHFEIDNQHNMDCFEHWNQVSV